MNNNEVFKEYGSEQWVIEHNLYFLIREYWDECHAKYGDSALKCKEPPINIVGFIKDFMKKETLVEIDFAEKSKMETLANTGIINADYTEIEGD